ncbi:MAG: tripartite tricarboxylate transporter permease [Deltaproteobacteria bacterium]|jgi:TctA family transporter|nr:tripartite tricarboxylate transporter permease [Deltaproteobacteria bacterium]
MEFLLQGLSLLMAPKVLLIICISSIYGLFVGAMPGLTATMAAALLIPFTFFMDPVPALVSIVTMSAMAIFAGDIPAALVRIPGTPSSAAYTQDSFELTKQGKAEMVLGVDVICSAIGGLMGAVVLMTSAPLLAEVAMQFSSFEYFWLAALGLSATVMVSRGSQVKGALAMILGLFLSTIGVDITLGLPRFTFGSVELLNGVDFIPAMIGVFGISEVLRNVLEGEMSYPITRVRAGKIFSGMGALIRRYKVNILRSGLLGTFIGILPGAGADIAAWLAYAVSKRSSKEPEKYGAGSIEAIVDSGTANNACLAGDWVPALVFGIPGDSITAIVIGVLFMKGLRPGPMIFERQPEIVYAVYLAFILANLLMIPFGYLAIKASSQMLRVPKNILMPAILMFCIVGSFAINNSVFDIGTMLLMGVVGYFMEANGYPVAPIVLGLVLGPILEQNFMISMIKSEWDLTLFFIRPISAILGGLTIIVWFFPVLATFLEKAKKRNSL